MPFPVGVLAIDAACGRRARARSASISEIRMPSRRPRSATRTRSVGHSRRIASKMAQPGSTRSARSRPMQGCATRRSNGMPSSAVIVVGDLARRHPEAIDLLALVALEPEVEARQRRHRARGADQVHRMLGDHLPQLFAALGTARRCSATNATIASNVSAVTSTPPNRSAIDTTPTGSDCHERIDAAVRPCRFGRPPRKSSQASSDEPPPMSNISAPALSRSIRSAQPVTASSASVRRSTISSVEPELASRRGR